MSWVLTILGIVVLIVLHELGHFTVAKAVGMRVERFSLFFPPTLFRVNGGDGVRDRGDPGGRLREDHRHEPGGDRRARSGGGQARLLRAGAVEAHRGDPGRAGGEHPDRLRLFWAVVSSGNLNGASWLESLNPSVHTVVSTTSVQAIERGKPAAGVLRPGDRILAVDGQAVTVNSAMQRIASHRCAGALSDGCRAATPVTLTVRRGGHTLTLSVFPRYSKAVGRMLVGFNFGAAAKPFGLLAAAGASASEMWHITTQTLTGFGHALTSAKARGQVHSIVGITEIAHESVVAGSGYAFVFLGFISLILAVINLFPFLPLDGGHVLWSVAEKVRGRRISLAAMYRFSSVGIVLLLFLVINGVSNDISRLGG